MEDPIQEIIARIPARPGLGPDGVAYLPPAGHLVTRWVDGRHWDVQEYRTPKNIRLLTETVKRIHAPPPNVAIFFAFPADGSVCTNRPEF
jgi:hypothetical protein